MHVKRLFELGVGYESLMKPFLPQGVPYVHGSSLWMWADYFPEAEIYACDIRDDVLINEGRIHSMQCDQNIPEELIALGKKWGPFDIVINDGDHHLYSQIITAKTLLPFVTAGGVFITEDCAEPGPLIDAVGEGQIVRFSKGPDDCLVVIRK
jgi:hypothetical protein